MYERNEKKKVAKKVGEKYKKILTVDNATEIAIKNQVGKDGINSFLPFSNNQFERYFLLVGRTNSFCVILVMFWDFSG